ncbi:MAG: Xaa-Pro peptidase family protein [Rhodospirillales bacterium]
MTADIKAGSFGEARTHALQARLKDAGIDWAVLTDPDSVAYFGGYWNYLGMEFGRPTLMLVPAIGTPAIVTPLMESDMCREMTWVQDVHPWEDGDGAPWGDAARAVIGANARIALGVEAAKIPPLIAGFLGQELPHAALRDAGPIIADMRMVKDAAEIEILREAGQVAVAMIASGRAAIAEGVPEYELALAVIDGATRKAAELIGEGDVARHFSPMVHGLQVLQSGHDTCLVHRRASTRRLQKGDPIYFCCCGMVNYKHYKLGFDRNFFVGSVTDEQARHYEVTVAAQAAALKALRPGAIAEEVHAEAEAVYRDAGLAPGYRTGRAVGYSFLETPEIKRGDRTALKPGMVFAVDGGITIAGRYGTRIGDSVLITDGGYEWLTEYPRDLMVV